MLLEFMILSNTRLVIKPSASTTFIRVNFAGLIAVSTIITHMPNDSTR